MGKAWSFARQPRNLALLIALGGAVGFLWDHWHDKPKPRDADASVQATARTGDAIAAAPGAQVANAAAGGTAINSRDQAEVDIK